MSASVETAAAARKRSIEARRAARLEKARREGRIVDLLNRGVSVAEIAARQGVTEKRMRALVSEILARRMPEPPAEFLALQVSRLNEALLVAYGAMSGGNLGAVDRVVKIVRELDRYHGFSAADRRSHSRRIEAKAAGPLALAADRPEMAPQSLERIESAPGNALVPAASNPEDAALRRDPAFAFPLAPAQTAPLTDRLEAPSQEPDKVQSAPGNGRPQPSPRTKPRASLRRPKTAPMRSRPIARKWRRKGLKRLNPRPEMARPRTRRTKPSRRPWPRPRKTPSRPRILSRLTRR